MSILQQSTFRFELIHFIALKAKNGGTKIEEIRSNIVYHKEAIERLRRNHAIDMISRTRDYSEDDLSSQEMFHSEAIEKAKRSYNETIGYLRKLKGTIEHQQKVVEKARTKMQSDFDTWYREMCRQDFSQQQQQQQQAIAPVNKQKVEETKIVKDIHSDHHMPSQNTEKSTTEESDFVLPPGVKLTGNKEADDDIIAFFKAKQVLLSRTKKK